MSMERYVRAVTATMDDVLRARVQEELLEHWSDAQEAGEQSDPEALFGDPALLSQQLTAAMKPSTRVTDVLLSILLACTLFLFTVTMNETLMTSLQSSVATRWGQFLFFLGSGVGISAVYAAVLLPIGFFFHHLRITAPGTLFAQRAKSLSYSLGVGLGIAALLPEVVSMFSHPERVFGDVVRVASLILLILLSLFGYFWASWFSELPTKKVDRVARVFRRLSPFLLFTASTLSLFLISEPGANFINSPIAPVLGPVLVLLSPIAILLMFTRFFSLIPPGLPDYYLLTGMQAWAVLFIFLPLLTLAVMSFLRRRVSYATRLAFAFFLPLFLFSPLLTISYPSPAWKTTVYWSSATYEHERTGLLAPWALTTVGPFDNRSLTYAVYKGDGDIRIFADPTVFFSAGATNIIPLSGDVFMPVAQSLASGIVEPEFSCSKTPLRDSGDWIFPCGTLTYQGKPLADLSDITLREAIVVPGSSRAVIHVSRGVGAELVAVVELPQ